MKFPMLKRPSRGLMIRPSEFITYQQGWYAYEYVWISGKGIRCPFESVRHTTVWIAGGMAFEMISKEFEEKHGEPIRLCDVT